MKHTVISKTGWTTDSWHVVDTFNTRQAAQRCVARIRQRIDPKQDHYNVTVKKHRKELSELLISRDTVEFNDGTRATWD